MISDIAKDLKYALRSTIKNPVFALIGVLTIAIGIGANVLVFSLVERTLLNPLPYHEPDRLVRMLQAYPDVGLDEIDVLRGKPITDRAAAENKLREICGEIKRTSFAAAAC